MVVKTQEQNNNSSNKNMKDLTFDPILTVNDEIKMSNTSKEMYKCSVDTDLRLLGMETDEWFECMNIDTKEVIFEQKCKLDDKGRHCHSWIVINNEKYISLQTDMNIIKMFKVLKKNNMFEFEEDEAYRITYDKMDSINFCEFDKNFENI
eukprot:20699_1